MLSLKSGQYAPLLIDPSGIALLKGAKPDFRSSDERVCVVKPDGSGVGCLVYASDGGEGQQAQVLVYLGEDIISTEDVEVIAQDKPALAVVLVVGVPADVPA
jgi:hypothetical protein